MAEFRRWHRGKSSILYRGVTLRTMQRGKRVWQRKEQIGEDSRVEMRAGKRRT